MNNKTTNIQQIVFTTSDLTPMNKGRSGECTDAHGLCPHCDALSARCRASSCRFRAHNIPHHTCHTIIAASEPSISDRSSTTASVVEERDTCGSDGKDEDAGWGSAGGAGGGSSSTIGGDSATDTDCVKSFDELGLREELLVRI